MQCKDKAITVLVNANNVQCNDKFSMFIHECSMETTNAIKYMFISNKSKGSDWKCSYGLTDRLVNSKSILLSLLVLPFNRKKCFRSQKR